MLILNPFGAGKPADGAIAFCSQDTSTYRNVTAATLTFCAQDTSTYRNVTAATVVFCSQDTSTYPRP